MTWVWFLRPMAYTHTHTNKLIKCNLRYLQTCLRTARSTGGSSRGSRFNSQYQHGGSQPYFRRFTSSFRGFRALFWLPQASGTQKAHRHAGETPTHIKCVVGVAKKNTKDNKYPFFKTVSLTWWWFFEANEINSAAQSGLDSCRQSTCVRWWCFLCQHRSLYVLIKSILPDWCWRFCYAYQPFPWEICSPILCQIAISSSLDFHLPTRILVARVINPQVYHIIRSLLWSAFV